MSTALDFIWHISLTEVSSSLQSLVFSLPLFLLVLVGVFYCFFGRELFDLFNFFIGGFIGLGLVEATVSASGGALVLLAIFSFLIGGLFGFFLPYLLIGVIGFSLGVFLMSGASPLLALILGVAISAVAILLFRFLLPILTSLVGGVLTSMAVYGWTGHEGISLIIGLVLFSMGAMFQSLELDKEVKKGLIKTD